MEAGTISPEGYHQWDGEKWLPVELGKVSEDGYWIWNGEKWVGNKGVQAHGLVEERHPIYEEPTSRPNPSLHTQEMIIIQQGRNKSGTSAKLSLVIIIPVVLVALFTVLAGVLYVWASELSGESIFSENERNIEGTWYNPNETITFYPNGTVSEASGSITDWRVEDNNLTLTYQFDEERFDLRFIHTIVYDSEGDSLLILALYEIENQSQTNVVNESSCFGYSDSVLGSEPGHFEERRLIYPEWCNPEEE